MKIRNRTSEPSKDLGSPAWVIGYVLVIFVLSQFVAALIVQSAAALITHSDAVSLDNSVPAQFVYVLLAEGLSIALVLYALRLRRLPPSTIGLGRRPNPSDLRRGLVGFGIFYGLLIVSSIILSTIFPELNKGTQDVGFNNLNTGLQSALAFVALVFLPPLGEEVLVRGYLYSGLRARLRYVPAMLVTSLLFGAAHLATGDSGALWSAGVNTFILSLVLVYLRETTGALYAGMLVHMLNNLIAFGVHFH